MQHSFYTFLFNKWHLLFQNVFQNLCELNMKVGIKSIHMVFGGVVLNFTRISWTTGMEMKFYYLTPLKVKVDYESSFFCSTLWYNPMKCRIEFCFFLLLFSDILYLVLFSSFLLFDFCLCCVRPHPFLDLSLDFTHSFYALTLVLPCLG